MTESDSLTSALAWIEQLLVGRVASVVAILAVAGFGLTMVAGRLPWRRGVEVIFGMFLIFGSSIVSRGLLDRQPVQTNDVGPAAPAPAVTVNAPPPTVYDPYAGASVPQNRAVSDLLAPHP